MRRNQLNARIVMAVVGGMVVAGCERSRYRVPPILDTSVTIPWPERQTSGREFSSDYASAINVLNPYYYNPANGNISDPVKWPHPPLYTIASGHATKSEYREDAARKEARNQLQSAIVRLSDEAFASHVARLKASEVATNSTLGILATGLAGGASLATGGAASALSVAAAVTSGSRGIINEQEYRNALVESIILLIQSDRRKVLQEMHQNQTLSIQQYDVERAMADATDYHFRGSFFNGLALLVEAARKSGSELEQSTLTLARARSELAKLLAIGNNKTRLAEIFVFDATKGGIADWLPKASAEDIGAALAFLRSSQQEESQLVVKYRKDMKDAERDEQEVVDQIIATIAERGRLEAELKQVAETSVEAVEKQRAQGGYILAQDANRLRDEALTLSRTVGDPAEIAQKEAEAKNTAASMVRAQVALETTSKAYEDAVEAVKKKNDPLIKAANERLEDLGKRKQKAKERLEQADRLYQAEVKRLASQSAQASPSEASDKPK